MEMDELTTLGEGDWYAKVEYLCDKTCGILKCKWIVDLPSVELPSFDVHKVYRGFWSAIEGETLETMLKEEQMVPYLTAAQEKECKRGFYRIRILAIKDDPLEFDLSRMRRNVFQDTSSEKRRGKIDRNKQVSETLKTGKVNLRNSQKPTKISEQMDSEIRSNSLSDEEECLVSDQQIQIWRTSIIMLKKKLLEKCKETEELKEKLQAKELEMNTLQKLNMSLQNTILDAIPKILVRTCSESSSRPMQRNDSDWAVQLISNKRKASDELCEEQLEENSSKLSNTFPLPLSSEMLNIESNQLDEYGSLLPVIDLGSSEFNLPVDEVEEFNPGLFVCKKKLKKIEERRLDKSEDGSFVKELAVLVFGHRVLYNASLIERRYSRSGEETKRPRKKLDEIIVEKIRHRLERRVFAEFDGSVPSTEFYRFSRAKVHRFIYEKIKKMRSTPSFSYLADGD